LSLRNNADNTRSQTGDKASRRNACVFQTVSGERIGGEESVQKSLARKAAPKRIVKKPAKPNSLRTKKQKGAAKRAAAIEKRKKTKAATNRTVGAEPIAVDPADEEAPAALAKRQVRGRRTAVHRLTIRPRPQASRWSSASPARWSANYRRSR
jgi:hypothetical protein